jgi:hypothetical protein
MICYCHQDYRNAERSSGSESVQYSFIICSFYCKHSLVASFYWGVLFSATCGRTSIDRKTEKDLGL